MGLWQTTLLSASMCNMGAITILSLKGCLRAIETRYVEHPQALCKYYILLKQKDRCRQSFWHKCKNRPPTPTFENDAVLANKGKGCTWLGTMDRLLSHFCLSEVHLMQRIYDWPKVPQWASAAGWGWKAGAPRSWPLLGTNCCVTHFVCFINRYLGLSVPTNLLS